MMQALLMHRRQLLTVAVVAVAVAACGGSADDPSDPAAVAEPPSGTDDGVRLREVDACDEPSQAFGAFLTGFEPYDASVVAGDDRYSCEWRRPAEPDGWDLAIILVGHYTNTPDFASNDWEGAGLTRVDDPRVDPFDGLVVRADQGTSRSIHVMGQHFDARLQVVALRGQEPDHIPVDDAIAILLELTES